MKNLEYNKFVEYEPDIIQEIEQTEKQIQDYNNYVESDEYKNACKHEQWNYCYQITKKNNIYYRLQCSICGASLGDKAWVKKSEIPEEYLEDIEEYNPAKHELWRRKQLEKQTKRREIYNELLQRKQSLQSKLWWKNYEDYLCSDEWEKKRQMRLHMNKQILLGYCECCGEKKAIMCHHLHYKTLTMELMTDLAAVCSECHKKIHNHLRGE